MSELTLDSLLDSISDSTETIIEKVASETEVSVADQLKDTLTKEASASESIGDTNMSVETGNSIADSILSMLDGMNKEAAAGNNVAVETAEMEAQHGERITQTPRQGKTVTEVAKALAAKTPGQQEDDIEATEGNSEAAVSAIPSDIEKAAAVDGLMGEGYAFEDAVELVKQASEEIAAEDAELEKIAAVNALIGEGINFEDAIELVKQASHEMDYEEEYSDMEKMAAVQELMVEDGLDFEEASELVKQAAEESAPKMSTKKKVALGVMGLSAAGLGAKGIAKAVAKRGAKGTGVALRR